MAKVKGASGWSVIPWSGTWWVTTMMGRSRGWRPFRPLVTSKRWRSTAKAPVRVAAHMGGVGFGEGKRYVGVGAGVLYRAGVVSGEQFV